MTRFIRRLAKLTLWALVLGFALPLTAQTEGRLIVGQPSLGTLTDAAAVVTYDYALGQDSVVVIEAFGEEAAPALSVLLNGALVAAQPNAEGAITVSLSAALSAGAYTVQVSSANAAGGLVIVVVDSETAINAQPLALGTPISGVVSADAPLTVYTVAGLAAPAYLYMTQSGGSDVRVLNAETGSISAVIAGDFPDARLQMPANGRSYRIEVLYTEANSAHTYTLCLITVGQNGCSSEPLPPAPVATEAASPPPVATCMLTPVNAGGVNIRQSASVNAPVVGGIPGGVSVPVLGISPDTTFFNLAYNGVNGWVAASAVSVTANCGALPVVNPPPVSVPPTQPPPPTPSGPCLIRMQGEQLIYSQPMADPSVIYDEVQPGYELIPIGRLADNSWWRTNYAMAWIQTSTFGSTATVSGDCSALPIVSP